jgi:GTP-binding protein
VEELFLDLDADEHQVGFPIVYCNAAPGGSLDPLDLIPVDRRADADGLKPLFEMLLDDIPRPPSTRRTPSRPSSRTSASPYVGRLRLAASGTVTCARATWSWCRADGSMQNVRITELSVTEALDRVDATEVGPGDIIAIAGLADVTIGETLADPDDPRPLPVIHVDDPSLSMTIGINTSPLSGQDGSKLTARLVKGRLDAELVGNVSLRVLPTDRPDAGSAGERRAPARGARRDDAARGLRAHRRQADVVAEVNGKRHEPVERLTVDVPDDYLGVVTQLLARGRAGSSRWSTTAPAGFVSTTSFPLVG